MPTQETQLVDSIITSRRTLLATGGAALAAFALPSMARAASSISTYTDNDILNFALNLEYLEANFYYLAAFGTTISQTNSLYPSGAMVQGITGTGTQGTVVVKPTSTKVNFTNVAIGSYAVETAVEEGKHVAFLRSALGSAAVAQPQLDLFTSFYTLAFAAGITPSAATVFDPFASDANFLVAAYVFEDVGVSAYHGAAPLISQTTAGKGILAAAVGIHAVEAYHAGLIRTTINAVDNGVVFPAIPAGTLAGYTQKISALRATLANQLPQTPANPDDPNPDDYGVGTASVSLAGGSNVTRSQIVDADPTNVHGFARSTSQVLNIVTGGGAVTSGTKATGVFFPNGLNGLFS
ncbi:MAG: ferritin-like domain-containing protein [Acidobacteriota bacterium]|nr:ferritin-like domain-containing protein [Acidobacteriota bacterium]